jgi:hypothetical protein
MMRSHLIRTGEGIVALRVALLEPTPETPEGQVSVLREEVESLSTLLIQLKRKRSILKDFTKNWRPATN